MKQKTISLISFGILALSLIGCNRGCTTSRTIASESKTVSTNAGNAEVMARVIDYRHSKRIGDNIFERSVSHSYGLCFDVNFGTFNGKNFFHEGVKDPEAVNLSKELQRVKVAISKDQNHIGLGVDGKVVKLIHLYKSNPIATREEKLLADGTMSWSDLDIESYPSPSTILTKSMKHSCGDLTFGSDAMTEFCNSSSPTSKVHTELLNQWPDCSFTKRYLTEQKVRELSKNVKWKKQAAKRGKKVLKRIEHHNFDFDEIATFIAALNSAELNKKFDEMLMANWGKKGMTDYTAKLIKRIEEKKGPMDKATREEIYADAKAEFDEFEKTGRSNMRKEASDCLRLLQALGDTTTGYQFIQNAFGGGVSKYDQFDFLEVAYDNFSSYTDYQQRVILQQTEPTFESFKDYSRSSYYSAIEDLVDCSMLKRLKNKYPEDLRTRDVPDRCGP